MSLIIYTAKVLAERSAQVLWIRNCRQKLSLYKLQMQQRAADRRCGITERPPGSFHIRGISSLELFCVKWTRGRRLESVDIRSKLLLRQSMHIYLKKNFA